MSTILALAPPARRPMLEPLSARLDELARVLAPELAQRAAAGLVRDCHGDLRAEHVLLDGQVQICDCIEFDARLRAIDTGCDLAFLTMDLERLGAHPLAERLVALYRGAGGDPGSQRLRTLFAAYRALVRAKVALLRAGQLAGPAAAERRCEAESYMRLAWRFVWRTHEPIVIALCGPAGSGKSTLARELARTTGLPRISSDVTRKAMAGLAPRERGPALLYSDAMTARVYRELGRGAAEALAGDGAIVDATFRHARDRIAFCDELHAAAPVFVRCVAPPEIVLERVRRRTTGLETESDAGPEVAAHQLEDFEPLDDLPAGAWVEVSTDRPPALVAAEVEAMLAGSAAIAAVR
jgi:predicted kinase